MDKETAGRPKEIPFSWVLRSRIATRSSLDALFRVFGARNVLPDLASNTLEVMKLTALASVVSFAELLYSADMARSVTYNATPIVMAAALYLVIMWPLVRLAGRLEHRIAT